MFPNNKNKPWETRSVNYFPFGPSLPLTWIWMRRAAISRSSSFLTK